MARQRRRDFCRGCAFMKQVLVRVPAFQVARGLEGFMQDKFQVGAVASVHGIKGEVKVFPTTDEPEKFKKLKTVWMKTAKEEREITLQTVKFFKNMAIVKFEGIDSPEEAHKYRGATLWIPRAEAVPLKKDEY